MTSTRAGAALVLALLCGWSFSACGTGATNASPPGATPTGRAPGRNSSAPPATPASPPATTLTTAASPRATTLTTAASLPSTPRPPTTAPRRPVRRWAPPQPQPTESQSAWALVNAWASDDRKRALEDASPGAVASLFARAYPPGGPEYRGCSTPPGDAPGSCVWRSGNDLLSLTVAPFAHGWGVTAAIMEA